MIIFYPCGTELAFPLAGFTSLALGSVDRSFKSALSDTVTDFIFVLPEHVPKRTTAAPVAIAYQLIDLRLIQRQVHHGIFICLFNNFKGFIQAYSSSRPSVDVIFCSSAHIDAHLNRNGALPLSVFPLARTLKQCQGVLAFENFPDILGGQNPLYISDRFPPGYDSPFWHLSDDIGFHHLFE
jgi:hypothetical protein